ncbi:MAG: peptide-binding protein [Alicyclobacillus herbarius]|uniref:peptide-binding protein n=1 Tax=Alicyclobacillus herbarius TaxID=122960 RepID=UPI0023565495|nr:peptide-binding protein [Alicyclobacillus herbarius]MCL6631878.1 peptide-binding protein [Alicyclobacillus herbarius]
MKKLSKASMATVATAASLALLVAGCGSTGGNGSSNSTNATANKTGTQTGSSDKPVDGGTLTYGTFSDIVTLDPIYIADTASGDASQFIFAPLYDLDPQGNLVVQPWDLAAEPLKVSNGGKTYTVKLKQNAKWSDGKPVTADDVIFTLKTIMNPKAGSPGISEYDKIQSIKKVDDYTVQVTLKQVYAPFNYALGLLTPVPEHVLKNVDPSKLQKYAYGADPSKTVTDGPWVWKTWKQKQYLEFDRNPNYWGPKPHIDKVIYKIYADENTMTQALMKGDIDVDSAIPVQQLSAVENNQNDKVINKPGPMYEFLAFNFKASNFPGNFDPFTDPKTRQAIYYALDRQAMVKDILKGTGTIVNSPFLHNAWYDVNDQATSFTYDPAKAKQLLKEAGWKPGPDGILQKDGHKFSFQLQYNTGNTRREQVASVIQQELKAVGIDCQPKGIDFSAWIDQNLNPGKFQAVLLSWQMNTPDPDQESIYSSKYFPPNGQNMGWYKNTETDKLWVEGYSTVDRAKRKQIYGQIAKDFSQDPPYVFLYQYGAPAGYTSRVHWKAQDAPQLGLSYGYLYHVQTWWLSNQ